VKPGDASERWERVNELLSAALERDAGARDAFLRDAAAGDDALYSEVASLLAAHERTGALDRLAGDLQPITGRLREGRSLTGERAGRYDVLERIGGGGMGVVHRAMDDRLGRSVALKFLRPRLDGDPSAAERFRLEARTIAALEHPNICTVHEIGETDDGRLFLAMPLYEGETLAARIARGPLGVEEAVAIAIQVARALAKAHARGIIHRDIKPSNVFITSDEVAKLLDFGIVKLAGIALTGNAGPLGTPSYMSPEQARGAPLDHRTDLWSLGVVLYEMLTGRKPFEGQAGVEVIAAVHRSEPLPLAARRPALAPALERIVATALAKDPSRRYQSAQALEGDLLALGVVGSVSGTFAPVAKPATEAPSRRVPRWLALVAIALLAVLLMAGVLLAG
jgi:serine/threonine protein kinase